MQPYEASGVEVEVEKLWVLRGDLWEGGVCKESTLMLTIAWRGDSRSQERLKSRPKGDARRLSRGQDSQLWWLMPRTPALRQEDNREFEGGLPYIANSRLARATQQDPVCHDPSLLQRPVCLPPLGGGDEDRHRRQAERFCVHWGGAHIEIQVLGSSGCDGQS